MTMSDQEMKEHAAVLIRRGAVGVVSVHEYLEEKMAETRDGDQVSALPSREEFTRLRNRIYDLIGEAVITIAWPEENVPAKKEQHGD